MKILTCYMLSVVLLACFGAILAQNADANEHTSTLEPTATPTEHVTPTESTHSTEKTDVPTTTHASTTTSTEHSTTTTTTTMHPNTTTTTSTTHSPETTTSTTTTSTTTPVPQPTVPTYEVMDEKTGNYCIIVQALPSLRITYLDKANATQIKDFDLKDETITPSGECLANHTFMSLRWTPKNGGSAAWFLNITFDKIVSSMVAKDPEMYGVTELSLDYTVEERIFPGAQKTGPVLVLTKGNIFKAHVGNYYSCSANETIQLKATDEQDVLLHTRDTKIQAFLSTKTKDHFLGNAEACSADSKTSSLVPILVGVGLAIMILIALVVFLIGSRRRAATYESL